MIIFPQGLVDAASKAGIKIPASKQVDKKYPHWYVFCMCQLGRHMPSSHSHYNNASVVSSVSDEEIFKITLRQLINKGFE